MRRSYWRWITAAALGLLLVVPGIPAEARERSAKSNRSSATARSGGGNRSAARPATPRTSAGSRSTARSARGSVRTSNRTEVRGTPTYGYGGGYRHDGFHRGYHDYPLYYGPYGYWYGYWGYPYWYGFGYGAPRYVEIVEGGERRLPAAVETDVRPKRAEVWVDEEYRGQARDFNGSWDLLILEPGRRILEFRKEGYKTLRLALNARAGLHLRIDDRLEKGAGIVERALDLPPAAAEAESRVVAGSDEPRFEVESSEPAALREGLLRVVASPPDAAVYLDGEFLANASDLARLHGALPVAVGRHVIDVVRPGYRGAQQAVTVDGPEPALVEIRLEPASERP